MKVIKAFPPNYQRLVRLFPIRGKNVFFAYGDKVYNPGGQRVPPEIIAHEQIHIHQQSGIDPAVWWDKYCDDAKFRYGVEIPAHRAVAQFLRDHGCKWGQVAERLAGPLYGTGLTYQEAVQLLS